MTLNVYFENNNIAFVQNITLKAAITCKPLEDHVLTYAKSTLYERVVGFQSYCVSTQHANGLILMEFISCRKKN